MTSPELHRGLVHRHVVAELVLVERELRTSRWPDRELGDGDEEFDKPLGHISEHRVSQLLPAIHKSRQKILSSRVINL